MRKMLALSALVGTFAFAAAGAQAQSLLVNGDFSAPGSLGNVAPGWTLTEGPSTTDVPPVVANSAEFIGFADHTTPTPDSVGLWLRSFAGGLNATAPPTVFADVEQAVAGLPGFVYTLTAWSRFELHYAGGLDNLNDGAPEAVGESTTDGAASPTDTELAIEFLGLGNVVLGSTVLELRADGQINNNMWRQHTLSGVSPLGTISVNVRGSLINGVLNPGVNPQSAFLDDFSLTAVPVPEPATAALAGLGLAALAAFRRRK